MNFLYFKNDWFFASFDDVVSYHGGNFTNLYKSDKIYKYFFYSISGSNKLPFTSQYFLYISKLPIL